MRKLFVLAFLSPLTLLAACGDDTGSGGGSTSTTVTSGPGSTTTGTPTTTTTTTTTTTSASTTTASTTGAGGGADFAITSTAFNQGDMIPEVYECQNGGGENISPPLAWTAGPPGTMSYAIVMRDTSINFTHWVIWDIPVTAMALPEDVGGGFMVADPAGAKQVDPYFGPCSPNSVNTYEWRLYAIDVATIPGLDQSSNNNEAAAAIVDASIAETAISGES